MKKIVEKHTNLVAATVKYTSADFPAPAGLCTSTLIIDALGLLSSTVGREDFDFFFVGTVAVMAPPEVSIPKERNPMSRLTLLGSLPLKKSESSLKYRGCEWIHRPR